MFRALQNNGTFFLYKRHFYSCCYAKQRKKLKIKFAR